MSCSTVGMHKKPWTVLCRSKTSRSKSPCVRACVRVCVRVYVHVCVRVHVHIHVCCVRFLHVCDYCHAPVSCSRVAECFVTYQCNGDIVLTTSNAAVPQSTSNMKMVELLLLSVYSITNDFVRPGCILKTNVCLLRLT